MPKTASLNIRVDPKVKSEVEAIYAQYGMSVTNAVNVFLHVSKNTGGLPFDLRPSLPNSKTIEAIKEGSQIIKSGKGRFTTADKLLKELKS